MFMQPKVTFSGKSWITAAVSLSLLATSADGAVLPEPVDLKAAFCAGVLKDYQPTNLTAPDGKPLPQEIQAQVKEINQIGSDARRRVLLYLVPRISYLDPTSLQAALSEGEIANKQALEAITLCIQDNGSTPDRSCVDKARARIKDCFPPDFLPF